MIRATFRLESPAFKNGAMIPRKYTCDGEDISPPLKWADAPIGTMSFALVCDDPDAPIKTWTHWVVYAIPAERTELKEGVSTHEVIEGGIRQGVNSWRKSGYGGPCPPGKEPHRYFFKLYALDFVPELRAGNKKEALWTAMEGHVLAETQLIGLYAR